MSLRASDYEKNAEDIAKLIQLYQNIIDKQKQAQETMADVQKEQMAQMQQQMPVDTGALQQQGGQEQVQLATPQITTEEGE